MAPQEFQGVNRRSSIVTGQSSIVKRFLTTLLLTLPAAAQQPASCNPPAREAITHVALPGNPFTPVATADGCWVFVTMTAPHSGVAVLKRLGDTVSLVRVTAGAAAVIGRIPAGAFPRELRVTADGKTLLVTNFNSRTLQLVDIARMNPR